MKRKKYTLNDYEITKDGIIINKHNNHVRIPQPNNKGYLRIMVNGKNYFVHRLVAEKYIPNPNNLPQVNHIDGNKLNNKYDNLEWVDNQQNRNHAIANGLHLTGDKCSWSKLNTEKVKFIRNNIGNYSYKEFADMFNVNKKTIISVVKNQSWKHVK